MDEVGKFVTSEGRCIYAFQVPAFPGLMANIYLVDDGDRLTLIDAGSGLEPCNERLLAGIEAIQSSFNRTISLAALHAIIVTHGHIDHFGGLPFLRQFTAAPVGVHPLDRRVLSNYEERRLVASRRLEIFLEGAGVSARTRHDLMAMYLWAKDSYRSQPVQFLLEEGQPVPADFQVVHVPGHCPGQVCLRLDDVLLTADHVLSRITPHQAPESITNHMGLSHYLASLDKIGQMDGIRLGLGGHEEPIPDLPARLQAIKQAHQERLEKTLALCAEPRTVAEVSKGLFGPVQSYHVLLALEETGAHVEYLYQRGELVAANLDEIEQQERPVFRYVRA